MLRLFKNRNFIFLLSIALGLGLPQAANWTRPLMLPALALVMMLATISVPNDFFRSTRSIMMTSFAGILMTYFILGGVILASASLLINNENIWIGFVLIAAVPPAIAVIPFTAVLEGDVPYSLAGTVASYLSALLIMPLMFFVFIGRNLAEPYKLIEIMILLIVLPLVLSRIILYFNFQHRIASFRGVLTDWGFFIVLYTIIGLNRGVILSQPLMILPVAFVVFTGTFLLGFFIERFGRLFKLNQNKIISLTLLGTMKNQGIAGGLAISLFPEEVALPSAVYSIFMILYFIWLDLRRCRQK
jgi:BASS family bile acid:Na+ symporter